MPFLLSKFRANAGGSAGPTPLQCNNHKAKQVFSEAAATAVAPLAAAQDEWAWPPSIERTGHCWRYHE